MPHLPAAHHETSKRDSPNETKIKEKKQNYPGFKFKPHQVNDSSQSNQVTVHLVSQAFFYNLLALALLASFEGNVLFS
jgi:hypothetical protein